MEQKVSVWLSLPRTLKPFFLTAVASFYYLNLFFLFISMTLVYILVLVLLYYSIYKLFSSFITVNFVFKLDFFSISMTFLCFQNLLPLPLQWDFFVSEPKMLPGSDSLALSRCRVVALQSMHVSTPTNLCQRNNFCLFIKEDHCQSFASMTWRHRAIQKRAKLFYYLPVHDRIRSDCPSYLSENATQDAKTF